MIWVEERIPESGKWLLEINPMTYFLAGYRNIFMHGTQPEYLALLYIGLFSTLVIAFMAHYYSEYEHKLIKAL